jgi:transaldolase
MSDRLRRLHDEFGQSPWLDNLSRGDLQSGRLASFVDAGVRGLTSNPTIFAKAITGGAEYDSQFARELSETPDVTRAMWELIISDIGAALDLLSGTHTASGGMDGHVSVEVDPRLARDASSTVAAAHWLNGRIDRPNTMIKVPATVEGTAAIEQLIADGVSVNVTLIFSLERYEQVIEAYLRGLERRLEEGLPLDHISSVASFFISRVDTEIDKRLDLIGGAATSLKGTGAVAQASLAFDLAERSHSGTRWERLRAAGARPQRPLWASTSTKNPLYPDTKYVDHLIGPGTVNTLPEQTLVAFSEHGTLRRTIDEDLALARQQWSDIQESGIDVDDVAAQLESEGLDAFVESFTHLESSLAGKARGVGLMK